MLEAARGVWDLFSGLIVPLLKDDDAIGVIEVAVRGVQEFSPREIALLETFADQAVIAIENAGSSTSCSRATGRSERLSSVSARPRKFSSR